MRDLIVDAGESRLPPFSWREQNLTPGLRGTVCLDLGSRKVIAEPHGQKSRRDSKSLRQRKESA